MTLEQLRIFVAVVEAGQVTRAAKTLAITQSAASAAIASLERRYGVKLFDRLGRSFHLTETGHRFYPEARAVLDRVSVARATLEDLSDLARGKISIAASQTIANYWLPRRLTSYHQAYPGVELNVTIGNTKQVECAIVDGTADIGLVEGPTRHNVLVRRHLDRDQLVLVIAASFQTDGTLGPLDLRELTWVMREDGSGTRSAFEEVAHKQGIPLHELRISLVLPGNEAVREAVEAGAGATIISEHVVASSISAGRLKTVPIKLPKREFAIVRHSERHVTKAVHALIRYLTIKHTTPDDTRCA